MNSAKQPEALLLVSPGCQYCRAMHKVLDEFAAENKISKLTIVDIAEQPDIAEQLGVRSVPWLRLGGFVLEGAHTPGELNKWIEASARENGWSEYFEQLLESGGLSLAEKMIEEDPARLKALIPLAKDPETPMQVRVGIAAILEGIQGTAEIKILVPSLIEVARNGDAKVRADACHFLALTGSKVALPVLEQYLDDENEMVREIANEGILELRQSQKAH
ncbi:MAG: thioredoxin family protein [Acidiferrobacterales bacterium]